MSEDARHALRAFALLLALTGASLYMLRAAPTLELRLVAARDRARARLESARAWHRAKAEVLFEAYYATREAAK